VTQATRTGSGAPALATPRQIYVMLGAPGAGKGTQAARLAQRLGLAHVSTGELFRASLRDGSPLGTEVRRYVERGVLVPDPLTVRVVRERLGRPDTAGGAILDGFPRTRPQAEALDRMLAADGSRVTSALYVEVDTPELVRRLAGRRLCTGPDHHVYHVESHPPRTEGICDIDGFPLEQRPDDRPETVQARLEKQLPPMFEVIDHYADTGVLCAVAGDRPMDEVTDELLRVTSRSARHG
jgi:adenylate kinase